MHIPETRKYEIEPDNLYAFQIMFEADSAEEAEATAAAMRQAIETVMRPLRPSGAGIDY